MHNNALRATVVPATLMSNQDFRRTRRIRRNVRLHQQLRDLVTAHSRSHYIGGNAGVENIAARLGFEPHDLAIVDIRIDRRLITLVVLPHRISAEPLSAARAIDLRHQARAEGHTAILVPQGVIEREPRLGNSHLLANTANVKVDATCRMIVLNHLIENGPSCLSELASLIVHVDPFGAVLHLATQGVVTIDVGQCITPFSVVDIAASANSQHS